jgi:HAMP domain-containing protein
MRYAILAIALAATVAAPAMARARHSEDVEAARMAKTFNDPRMQDSLADALGALTDAFMDVRIDRLRAAVSKIDPEARYDDDGARTIGEMVARDDPNFREHIDGQSRMALRTMGSMASGMAEMLPEFRRMAEEFGRKVERQSRRIDRY